MIVFIKKISTRFFIYSTSFLLLISSIVYYYKFKLDPFYARLISSHKDGLVIGTSRAAQSIDSRYFHWKAYNFAFTIKHSPFDYDYYRLIKKYHPKKSKRNLIHIIAVDPWSLMSFQGDKYENRNGSFSSVVSNNFLSPIIVYPGEFVNLKNEILFGELFSRKEFVNRNGRYVIPISKQQIKINYQQNLNSKLSDYRSSEVYKRGRISILRLKNLKRIINYLKRDGKVFLIRLPIDEKMLRLENKIYISFDNEMKQIANLYGLNYINLMSLNNKVHFTDGNHIWNGSSKYISKCINDSISNY
jgi:hypothetical protein